MAAKQYSVPFVVLTGLYKLCPQYPYPADMAMYSSFGSPAGMWWCGGKEKGEKGERRREGGGERS